MEDKQFKPWKVPSTTIREKVIDAWKDMNAGVKDLIKVSILSATLIGAGVAHEYFWRNYTEVGQQWVSDVNTRYGELKKNPTLSDYDRAATIVSEFYGLR